jgi:hypothetical protein
VSHSTEPLEGLPQRYSHVGMPDNPISSHSNNVSNRRRRTLNNVIEFPNPFGSAWGAGPTIIFEVDRRFAIDLVVTELYHKPAEVVPISKQRQRKGRSRSRKSERRKQEEEKPERERLAPRTNLSLATVRSNLLQCGCSEKNNVDRRLLTPIKDRIINCVAVMK